MTTPNTNNRITPSRNHAITSGKSYAITSTKTSKSSDKTDSPTPLRAHSEQRQRRPGQRMTVEQRQAAQDSFLDIFERTGNVRAACIKAGIHRSTVYEWQEHDETFALRFKQAEREVEDVLEGEAFRRAVRGVQKPLVSMGRLVIDASGNPVTITEYSDTLLMKMLAARHHLYGDKMRRVEVSGVDGAPIQTQGKQLVAFDVRSLNAEQLAALAAILEHVVAQENKEEG